jgi:VanZ family protein
MISELNTKKIRAKIPGFLCFLVLCGILVAGLWPFRRPLNGVTWLENGNGLHLAHRATLWSSGSFQTTGRQDEESRTLELWLEPSLTRTSSSILSFSTHENPQRLSAYQYHSVFIMKRQIQSGPHRTTTIGIDDTLLKDRSVFITVTSGPQETAMYVDGVLNQTFPQVRLGKDFAGQLIVGTSPVDDASWSGQLRGLAIYGQELTPPQVLKHYQSWTTQDRPEIADDERVIALYLFNEHAGNTVHNEVSGGVDLNIPRRYALVHQRFLRPFWQEYEASWDYWHDIAVNVFGLVPLGFVFCAYWSSVRRIKHPVLITTLLGLAVSLTIEVLQSYLPTRGSGTTDLFTNTLGAFLGAKLYDWKIARSLFAKIYPG